MATGHTKEGLVALALSSFSVDDIFEVGANAAELDSDSSLNLIAGVAPIGGGEGDAQLRSDELERSRNPRVEEVGECGGPVRSSIALDLLESADVRIGSFDVLLELEMLCLS